MTRSSYIPMPCRHMLPDARSNKHRVCAIGYLHRPSIGTCLSSCNRYHGPDRTDEFIKVTMSAHGMVSPKRRASLKRPRAVCAHLRIVKNNHISAPTCCGGQVASHHCTLHDTSCVIGNCVPEDRSVRSCVVCEDHTGRSV